MISHRLLYLDTHCLSAYFWQAGRLSEEARFDMRAAEYPRFSEYLRAHHNSHFRLLANVGDESYRLESIPFLRGADRQTLITRKMAQHFQSTPLALAVSLGFEQDKRKNEKLLLSALSNPAHWAPWLKCIKEAEAALAGIYSVAQLAGPLLEKLRRPAKRCLLLTLHEQAIRETYLIDGQTHFSRMAALTDSSIAGIAAGFASEAAKLQQYLVSQRLIERNNPLLVYVLAHPLATAALRNSCRDTGNLVFEILDNHQQAAQIGLKSFPDDNRSEFLFLHMLRNAPPRQQFASADHRHDYRISQIRYGLIAFGVIALLSGALFAASRFFQTYQLHQESQALDARTVEMNQHYREIAATFPPIAIDHETLRRITTRHDELVARQQLPGNAYRMIGNALNHSPAIQLEALDWQIGKAGKAVNGDKSNVPVGSDGDEIITLRGVIQLDTDASTRQILSTFDQFVAIFRIDRNNQIEVRQQPFDVESSRPLRGSDKDQESTGPRQFTLQISRPASP